MMDATLARRMHEVLAHQPGQYPGSCPVCAGEVSDNRPVHSNIERERIARGIPLPDEHAVPGGAA